MIQSQIQRFIAVMLFLTMALQGCNRSVDGFCVGGKKLGTNEKCPNGYSMKDCKHDRENSNSECEDGCFDDDKDFGECCDSFNGNSDGPTPDFSVNEEEDDDDESDDLSSSQIDPYKNNNQTGKNLITDSSETEGRSAEGEPSDYVEEEDDDEADEEDEEEEEEDDEDDEDEEDKEEDDDDKTSNKSKVSDHTSQNEENQSEQENDKDKENENGDTVLHRLVKENENKDTFVESLFYLKTDPSVQNDRGETAFHTALKIKSNRTVLDSLSLIWVAKHLDPNVQDNNGDTILHLALNDDRDDFVDFWLRFAKDCNIDLTVKNKNGDTPFHLAFRKDKRKLIDKLLKHERKILETHDEPVARRILCDLLERMEKKRKDKLAKQKESKKDIKKSSITKSYYEKEKNETYIDWMFEEKHEEIDKKSETKPESNKSIPKPKPEPEEEKKENIEEKKPDINRGEELEYLQKLEYCETDLEQRLKEIDEANKGNALNKLFYNQISTLNNELKEIREKKNQAQKKLNDHTLDTAKTIVDKIKIEMDDQKFLNKEPKEKVRAACNKGVAYMFKTLTGNNSLDGLLANDMGKVFSNTKEWNEISGPEGLQKLANDCKFIVAWRPEPGINPKDGNPNSGHVVLIMPGKERKSGEWECMVPMTMDTGEGHRWACDMLSYSFSKKKKQEIRYYKYIGNFKN